MYPIPATAYLSKLPGIASALLFFLFSHIGTSSVAQVQPSIVQEKAVSADHLVISVKDRPFQEVLSIIQSQTTFKFAYSTELILQQKNVTLSFTDISLSDLLGALLRETSLTYTIIGRQVVLQNMELPPRITVSGYIKDSRTGELLIGASIYTPSSRAGTSSNNYGFYSLTIPNADSVELEISYIGYKSEYRQVSAHTDLSFSFGLEHNFKQEEIKNLVISNDKREDNVKKNQSALIELSPDMIVTAPSVSGSGDVINSVQMLPGVQAGLDGIPGYSVRGGNSGQNLILLDEATLYTPSHVFGLVSIFNPPAVKYANLMKGGFPAAYGDHVSSVLDVSMKDGSNQQSGGIIQAGNISSGITLYGPLRSGHSSYLISARRSMIDLLFRPILSQNYFSNYYFYDLNAKLNFQLSRKDRLLLSFYTGQDKNDYSTDSTNYGAINYSMHFGNTAFTMRWNHVYSGKLFSNTSLIYNHYHQFLSATQENYFAQLYSGIRDINAKTDFYYYPSPSHKITAGANYLFQTLYPASFSEKINPTDSSAGIIPADIPPKTSTRLAVYASDDVKLGQRFKMYAGVRVPYYYRPGVQYLSVEPRLSLLYMVDPVTSVKASYTEMHQYIHLVQSFNSSFPAEIWIGSSNIARPQVSREVSAGIFRNFQENIFQTSLEFYYRQMKNQLLFKGGTTPTIDNNLEDQLIFGKGWSYGTEFLIRKNSGKWTGWLAYSFAFAYQQFDSLNLGQSFPFAYDRRHILDIATAYAFNKHWKIAANFFMASGRAYTLNTNSLNPNPNNNPLYGDDNGNGAQPASSTGIEANNYRLTPYNRLDLSISFKKCRKTVHRLLESEWILSVYNVYARQNSSFVYRTIDPSTKQVIANEVPLIPVIPSITYSFRF